MAQRRATGAIPGLGIDSIGRLASLLEQAWPSQAVANPGARPPSPFRAPVFDGTGDVELFIGHFEDVAEANQWNPHATLLHLRGSLTDEAKDCSRPRQADQIFAELRARFGITPREARTRVNGLKKDYGVTLHAHAVEVTRLVSIAYRELPEAMRDELALESFCSTLGNVRLQRHLLAVHTPTIADAVRAGNEFLQIRSGPGYPGVQSTEGPAGPAEVRPVAMKTPDPAVVECMLKTMQAMLAKMELLTSTKPPSKPEHRPKQVGRCWECGQEGHRHYKCPRLKGRKKKNPNPDSGNVDGPQ